MAFRQVRLIFTVIVAMAATAILAQPATAGCTTAEEQFAYERAIGRVLVCARLSMRSDRVRNCAAIAPPSCGAEQFAEMLELVGGLPEYTATGRSPQARCQQAAYGAAANFTKNRIRERNRGYRRQRRSLLATRILRLCDVSVIETTDGILPRFGGRCAGLASSGEDHLSGDRVRQCLRPAFENNVSALLELPPVRPNIVLVVTDDQRADTVGLMPSVLEIARQGVSFSNAFTTTPICAPARAGILTGQHATTHGVLANGIFDEASGLSSGAIDFDDTSTLATWFQAAGYRTAMHGKYMNQYGALSPQVPQGWDDWRVFVDDASNFFNYKLNENGQVREFGTRPADYSTDVIAQRALSFVRDNSNQPFLLVFAPFAPHGPSAPAPRHVFSLASLPPWRPPSWGADISTKPSWFRFFAVKEIDQLISFDTSVRRQRESLLAVDEAVAAIDDRLERLGLTDNTIFVYMSDHGFMWGEHRWISKQVAYEESVRIPLAMRYPLRLPADEVRTEFALHYDVAPTLTDLAGVEATHAMDGRSLVDAIEGAPDWRSDILVQHFIGGFIVPPWDMLRTEDFKLVRSQSGFLELYNLLEDPHELDNVANRPENAALVAALSARLEELLQP